MLAQRQYRLCFDICFCACWDRKYHTMSTTALVALLTCLCVAAGSGFPPIGRSEEQGSSCYCPGVCDYLPWLDSAFAVWHLLFRHWGLRLDVHIVVGCFSGALLSLLSRRTHFQNMKLLERCCARPWRVLHRSIAASPRVTRCTHGALLVLPYQCPWHSTLISARGAVRRS